MSTTRKAPTRDELFTLMADPEKLELNDKWNSLLNQPPHNDWISENNGFKYLPIDKVEFMLTALFQEWKPEIIREGLILNSVFVTVRLSIVWPPTGLWTFRDGIGAVPVQLDKGAAASDLSKIKAQAIQMNLPAAYSYALSNAAARFGKIFGRDLNRKNTLQYFGDFQADAVPPSTQQQIQEPLPENNIPATEPIQNVTQPQPQQVKIIL